MSLFPIKRYDKSGKVIEVIKEAKVSELYWDSINFDPQDRYALARRRQNTGSNKAKYRAMKCRNCGIRVKTQSKKATSCSVYCAAYFIKHVRDGKRKPFKDGGLDDFPKTKAKLEALVKGGKAYIFGGFYCPRPRDEDKL